MSETLATVIKSDPEWTALPTDVPHAVRTMLRTCLQKDPRKRTVDATTALFVLNEPDLATPGVALRAARESSIRTRALCALAGAVPAAILAAGVAWTLRPAPTPPQVARFSFELPEGQQFTNIGRPVIAISPDGTRIVYVANRRLYLRPISETAVKEIQGTEDPEGVTTPTFSPDGNSLAFVSALDRMLKRISIKGGVAVPLSPIRVSLGVSWTPDGIIFGERPGNVFRVSPNSRTPQQIFKPADGEGAYGAQILPGGAEMLLTMGRFTQGGLYPDAITDQHIILVSLRSGERRTLIEPGADARYVSTGHIVYAAEGALFAKRFDVERLQTVGDAVPVLEGVRRASNTPAAQYSLSSNGALAYVTGAELATAGLAWFDRQGKIRPLKVPNRSYQTPRLSPDGSQLAVQVDDSGTANIWIYDLSEAHALRPLTLDGRNRFPVWTRDGQRVAFSSDREGDVGVWLQRADGTGAAERVTTPERGIVHTPLSWHPREETLLMSKSTGGRLRGPSSLWTYSTADKKADRVAAVESRLPISAEFSPDGKWIAYQTFGESSRTTVSVLPYPPTGSPYRIDLGENPIWSRNGLELLFSKASELFVTSVTPSPSLNSGVSTRLPLLFTPSVWRNYDITRDGTRVLAVVPSRVMS